jgi:F0F1-type ATP synthase assembly protein I
MTDAPKQEQPVREGEIAPLALAGLGLQFGLALVAGVYLGQWIDQRLGSDPWGMLAGALLLGGGVFVGSYRRLMAQSRRKAAGEARKGRQSGE